MAALPGRVCAKTESYPCLKLFMWLVNQYKVHWRRNRLLQQFALSPWDSDPERLINTSSVFDNLWIFECHVWRRKGENTPMWNVQTQDIAQTGNQRTIWYAFLALSVVQINVLIPVFSSSCGDYNHNNKGTYCRKGEIEKASVHQIPKAKIY